MAEKRGKNLNLRLLRWRGWVQAAFLSVWMLPIGARLHGVCGPVFHCYSCPLATFACPIGVLAGFSSIHVFPFFAVGMLLVVGGLLGTFICGWVCPFGFLQDLAAKVPTRKFTLPRWMTYMRYVVLVGLVIVIPYLFGPEHPLYICRLCPAGALEGAGPEVVGAALAGRSIPWPSAAKITIVAVLAAAAFFTYRPWCTLFCPLGAIYGIFNRFSAVFLRLRADKCTSCSICRDVCPSGLEPDKRANDPRCTRCLECTQCPTGALGVGSVFKRGGGV